MSLGNEERNALDQFAYPNNQSQKTMKKLYTRDFLLSFSELDVCKKLPAGFDRSILSEFEDASQDRQNTAGNFSLYSFRRHEHGSSPPTRGVVGNFSQGVQGRWDGRSSGRSDKDSDSQSDRESDSGKRYGNQSRWSGPVPEHDGLLGSGSFPRSSGSAGGAYAPKFCVNGQSQLSRSNEPYHPPRPFKAVPHSRKAANDSYNDETFGSSDYTSEDRAEEEKKRRASFETWRKEQWEAAQEKEIKPDRSKYGFDITELMKDAKDEISLTHTRTEYDEILVNLSESTRANNPPQSHVLRPSVPPGFGSSISESNLGPRASIHPQSLQREGEVDEMWASDTMRSSKFAHLFLEEEKKKVNDPSSGGPDGLLSLIQGGGTDGSHVSDTLTSDTILPIALSRGSQTVDGNILPKLTSPRTEFPEQLCNLSNVYQPDEVSAVLTCEDLEKSILAGDGENHYASSVQDRSIPQVKEQQKVAVDNHASHHLLSLLQKADSADVAPSGSPGTRSSKHIDGIKISNFSPAPNDSEMSAEEFPSSGKTLTLESLFGSAFMKELQSVGCLASLQRDIEGSAGLDVLESNALAGAAADVVRSSLMGPTRTPYGSDVLPFREGGELVKSEHLTRFDGKETGGNLSHFRADKGPSFGEYGRSPDIRLPEEDSLIANDPLNFQNFLSARNSVKDELLPSAETTVSIKGKLASLDSIYRDERPVAGSQEHPLFLQSFR